MGSGASCVQLSPNMASSSRWPCRSGDCCRASTPGRAAFRVPASASGVGCEKTSQAPAGAGAALGFVLATVARAALAVAMIGAFVLAIYANRPA